MIFKRLFGVMSLALVLTVATITVLFPLLYLALGALLLFKLVTNKSTKGVMKGYFKLTLIVFADFSLMCVSIVVAKKLNGSFLGILFMLVAVILLLWVLWFVISSLLMNVTNLGNDSVNARLTNFASMIPVFRAININNVGNRTSSNSVDYYGLGLSKY